MFAITANLSSRAAVSLDARRSKAAKVNTTVRAATNWVLDGRNCAGSRTGDVGRFKNNIVSRIQCPITPIAVTDLCMQHQGKFVMLDAIFEQEGPDLYVYAHKADGCVPIPNPAKRLAPPRARPPPKNTRPRLVRSLLVFFTREKSDASALIGLSPHQPRHVT